MIHDAALRDAILRQHLYFFIWKAFAALHPGQDFTPAWHVRAIAHALERVARGECQRLLITVPPRHLKSICTAVALPAWLLGRDPALKIMVASYGGELATKHARDFRAVLSEEWYKALFPSTRLAVGGNREDEQLTTARGGRKAISLGGAATGFGADLIIVDDLMKAADAGSAAERERVKAYYEQTLLSRLNDKGAGKIIAIQQRLHEDDLAGYLIGTGQFEHLNLPAKAMTDEVIPIGFGQLHRRAKDEVLCPEREPAHVLDKLRLEMGAFAFSAQYQQDPTPPGGNRLRWEWFGSYDEVLPREAYQFVVQSWDTALTAEPTSDFSVGLTWGFRGDDWHLLDGARERLDFPDLKHRVRGLARRWRVDLVLIEHAGSGISLLQQLRAEERGHCIYNGCRPRQDKQTRFEGQTARLESGRYWLPRQAPWLEAFRRELLAFPHGRYDDQVDSLVQFLEWSGSPRGTGFIQRDPVTGRRLGGGRAPGYGFGRR
ncbi:phage terminase large subunit [Methylobacterium nigriterrae]|uniref:phage terminase large subunit n=1 Tax=Methylobacterium nigriterrae TaxID=3127512 RepID=UPI003013E2A0